MASPEAKSEIMLEPSITKKLDKIPSCYDIGIEASKKGDFRMARNMFRTAMEQLDANENKEIRSIELTICIADFYLNEGRHDSAKTWYEKALHASEILHGKNTFQIACLMARLAEICVLQSKIDEFQKCFDTLQQAYLLSEETDTANLLNSLIDLSWVLCVQGHLTEVQSVNDLINQIKQLNEENNLNALSA